VCSWAPKGLPALTAALALTGGDQVWPPSFETVVITRPTSKESTDWIRIRMVVARTILSWPLMPPPGITSILGKLASRSWTGIACTPGGKLTPPSVDLATRGTITLWPFGTALKAA
jgi:hypothetical protein